MVATKQWCAKALPYIEYFKQQEKYYIERVHDLLCDDLYAALPELKPLVAVTKTCVSQVTRGLGAAILLAVPSLITLAVKGISSWIKRKQQKCIDDAMLAMCRQEAEINELRQFSDDFLMYGKYNVETLMDVINTMNSMHKKQTELEKLVASPNFGITEGVVDAIYPSVLTYSYFSG